MLSAVLKGISVAATLLQNPTVKRYGSAIIKKIGGETGERIIGHLESLNLPLDKANVLVGNNGISETTKVLINDRIQAADKIIQKGSAILGGINSLSWGNLAANGISMGVTTTGIAVAEKKVLTINNEISRINSNMDSIMQEIIEVKTMVKGLQEKAISDEYEKASRLLKDTHGCIKALRNDSYTESFRREIERQMNATGSFLEKNIQNYTNSSSTIVIGLDEILSLFYAYVCLLKAYVSAVQLHDSKLVSYTEHQTCMKMLCSNTMITSIQDIYKNSTSSYMTPQDIAGIVSLYKEIMSEQISEVKSQHQILETLEQSEYVKLNEQLLKTNENEELAFIQY